MADELHQLAKEFADKRSLYADFGAALCTLVQKLAEMESVPIQSATNRAKDPASLSVKAHVGNDRYAKLEDITDLAGVRIISYFSGDIDKIAAAVEREFTIDRANSVDKRMATSPDRFGYASLHYVLSLSQNRTGLAEYRRFAGLKAELQVRSLLQHTWAEIEHDLGYKSQNAVPVSIQRRFARLAGLLELADEEFCSIRGALEHYRERVERQISAGATSATIDRISLQAFIQSNSVVERLEQGISSAFGGARLEPPGPQELGTHVERLADLGVRELTKLSEMLVASEPQIAQFAARWLVDAEEHEAISRGISLFYLEYFLMGQSKDVEQVAEHLRRFNIGTDRLPELVERIVSTAELVATAR